MISNRLPESLAAARLKVVSSQGLGFRGCCGLSMLCGLQDHAGTQSAHAREDVHPKDKNTFAALILGYREV